MGNLKHIWQDVDLELCTNKVIDSYVLHCLKSQRIAHICATRCPIVMKIGPKGNIFNPSFLKGGCNNPPTVHPGAQKHTAKG